ncbi:N-acetyltransferase [Micromonospora sp. NPDC048063]|uniref:N-acetyltransferase n=1 Tax=Micromonospora sp. NPDC048063 TaxID=3364256 RepID=UPI00370F9FCC
MQVAEAGLAVRRAGSGDARVLAAVLTDALVDGTVAAWLVPDPARRRSVLLRYFLFVLLHGLEHGQVDTTDNLSAVAVWYPRISPSRSSVELFGARFGLLRACANGVLPHTPHHYLAHLAARPGQDGASRALLSSYHRVLDSEGLPAYSEISSDQPRDSVLAQLGYQPRSPVLLEPGGPVLWRMWRSQPDGAQLGGLPRRVRLRRIATPFLGGVMPAASPRSP